MNSVSRATSGWPAQPARRSERSCGESIQRLTEGAAVARSRHLSLSSDRPGRSDVTGPALRMTQPVRILLPGVLLAVALSTGCGGPDPTPDDEPVPAAVDPAALEADVGPIVEAPLVPAADVPSWQPSLPPVDADGVRRALREAKKAHAEGRLLAAEA